MEGLDHVPSSLRPGGPPMMPPSMKRIPGVLVKRESILRQDLGLMALRSRKYKGFERDLLKSVFVAALAIR